MSTRTSRDKQKELQEKHQSILSALLKDEDNKYCVDCDAKGKRTEQMTSADQVDSFDDMKQLSGQIKQAFFCKLVPFLPQTCSFRSCLEDLVILELNVK